MDNYFKSYFSSHLESDLITKLNTDTYASINQIPHCISYHNISYCIRKHGIFCSKKKRILSHVNGKMYTGLNAILGPTGSGKTTLMDVLASRKDKRLLEGRVLVNGRPIPEYFRCMTGYVTQNIHLLDMVTVRESIYYSANLRLPSFVTAAEKRNSVQNVIDCLGLTRVSESRIGNLFIRGISGGELKRTHIAMELIISHPILFLDEPTTGLDSFASVELMETLKTLSRQGKLIIIAIHQPRYAIYKLFDSITLLSQGRTVYHGQARSAIEYFANLGYVCPERENPTDFFLDTIAKDELRKFDCNNLILSPDLPELFEKSELNSILQAGLHSNTSFCSSNYILSSQLSKGYQRGSLWQMYVIGIRSLTRILRSPTELLLTLTTVFICCIIFGGIYWQLGFSLSGLENRIGSLFLITILIVSYNLACIETFLESKIIFIHEHTNGYYRVSSYFIANLLPELIIKRILPTLIGYLISYFMIGFKSELANIGVFLLVTTLMLINAGALHMLLGCVTNSFSIAAVLSGFLYVLMVVFSGILINIESLPVSLQWVQYFSLFRLALSTLFVNELVGLEFCLDVFRKFTNDGSCYNATYSFSGQTISSIHSGEDYLKSHGIPFSHPFDLWRGILGLSLYAIILFILSYIALRFLKKEK